MTAEPRVTERPTSRDQGLAHSPASPPGGGLRRRPGSPQPRRRLGTVWRLVCRLARTRAARIVAAILVVLMLWTGWSLGRALTAPGTDTVAARVAEWARDHHLNWVVDRLEDVQYWLHPPQTGGEPAGGIPSVGIANSGSQAAAPGHTQEAGTGTPGPPPVRPPANPPLPHEGQWQTVDLVRGLPAVRVAYVRPDNVHTSYLAGLIWMDPTLVVAKMHPGTTDPGGTWPEPSLIPPDWRSSVLAGTNGGFRLIGSKGGYYAHGRTVIPLRDGAASFVIRQDGTATVADWGRDARMGPDILAVRQNLDLLVDGGQVNPTCVNNDQGQWGAADGGAFYIARSGIGITKTGALVYVAGPAMSVCSLGNVLQAAGVVRGMALDMNPGWIRGTYFTHENGQTIPHKLSDQMQPPPDRLFHISTRDFFAFYAR